MDTKKLRQKILDLAIHGKLVPQDPNDEPASVLLERIRAEKERLIAEGKIKHSKKTTTSDTSHYENVPFEVPEGWCYVVLNEIAFIGTGSTPSKSQKQYYGGNIPWISSSATNNSFISEPTDFITEKAIKETNCQLYPVGTIIMAMYGEGKTRGQVSELSIECCTNQACAGIIPYLPETKKYIKLYLQSQYYHLRSLAEGGNQPNLNIGKISSYVIPLPPVAEQRRILQVVEKYFLIASIIESSKSDIRETINKAKNHVLDLAIHGKLVPQDPTDEPASELLKRINPKAVTSCDNPHYEDIPFELPESWKWLKHNDVIEISGGSQPPKSNFITIPKTGYIRLYQIRDYGERPSPVYIPISQASKIANPGDILLARYGASLGKVFKAEYGAYNVAMAKVVERVKGLFDIDFLFLYYHTELYRSTIFSVSRSAQNGFNKTDLEAMYIPIPPIAEQHRIVSKVNELFSQLDMIEKSLQA